MFGEVTKIDAFVIVRLEFENHYFLCSSSFWFCCVDVSVSRQMLVTGDNVGQLLLLSMDGQKVIVHPSIAAFLLQIKVVLLPSSMLFLCH